MRGIWRRQASSYVQDESEQARIAHRRDGPCLPPKTEKAALPAALDIPFTSYVRLRK
jgi:hypothetical protein